MTTSPPEDTYRMFTVFAGTKTAPFRTILIQMACDHWIHILVPIQFVLGCYLDKMNDEKLTHCLPEKESVI